MTPGVVNSSPDRREVDVSPAGGGRPQGRMSWHGRNQGRSWHSHDGGPRRGLVVGVDSTVGSGSSGTLGSTIGSGGGNGAAASTVGAEINSSSAGAEDGAGDASVGAATGGTRVGVGVGVAVGAAGVVGVVAGASGEAAGAAAAKSSWREDHRPPRPGLLRRSRPSPPATLRWRPVVRAPSSASGSWRSTRRCRRPPQPWFQQSRRRPLRRRQWPRCRCRRGRRDREGRARERP